MQIELVFRGEPGARFTKVGLRSFSCFAVRSSTAHEGKIVFFLRDFTVP